MRRRLIQHGPSSLSISLPHRWVREHNLSKGDEVTLTEDDERITIQSEVKPAARNATETSLAGTDAATQRDLILVLYQKGYDEITLHDVDESAVRTVHNLLNEMHLGYEIVAQGDRHLCIRDLSSSNGEEFENCLRRSFRLMVEYLQRVRERMGADMHTVTSSYLFHEASIGRICHYCKKVALSRRSRDSAFYHMLCCSVMAICYETSRLHEQVLDTEDTPVWLRELTDEVIQLLSSSSELYHSFSLSRYRRLRQEAAEIGQRLERSLSAEEHAALQPLEQMLRRSQDMLYAVMALQSWDKQ